MVGVGGPSSILPSPPPPPPRGCGCGCGCCPVKVSGAAAAPADLPRGGDSREGDKRGIGDNKGMGEREEESREGWGFRMPSR